MKKVKTKNGYTIKADDDFDLLPEQIGYYINTNHCQRRKMYVIEDRSRIKLTLENYIMGTKRKKYEHKNGDYLDCRRSNLKQYSQTVINAKAKNYSNKFKGVTSRKKDYLWQITIYITCQKKVVFTMPDYEPLERAAAFL